jgi:hypothetical protein
MHKTVLLFLAFFILSPGFRAAKALPDTVYTGIYITSIHNIDFKQQEYTVNFWLWMKYKNKDFDFATNLEVPEAKTVSRSYFTMDTTGSKIYILMKLQCVMKDTWKIGHFPFDRQKLRLSLENSQFDSHALVFTPDTRGKHYDPKFTLSGWTIDTFNVSAKNKIYETAFGDANMVKPQSEYSSFKVSIGIERRAFELFWKMFLGMYVAFFIAFVCFYIHADSIDARFGLSVGGLFAVVGNKYVIDSVLPESSTFTLVDTLHGVTLLFIFGVIVSSAIALYLVKKYDITKANRFDRISAYVVSVAYLALNIVYIYRASRHE